MVGVMSELPAMDHSPGAVGSQYHPALGREICRRMAEGRTIREIVADPQMPSYATVFRWRKIHADFADMYDAVRARRAAEILARREEIETWKPFWRAHRARLGLGRGWVSGRRSTYSLKAAKAICRRIARGEALSWVTADPAMPSAKAVYGWLRREPAFRKLYAEAVEERDWRHEGLVEALFMVETLAQWRTAKRRIAKLDGRRGRMAPRIYGRGG